MGKRTTANQIIDKKSEIRRNFLLNNLGENDGRYEIYCQWKKNSAHVFSAYTENHKVLMFDPQTENQVLILSSI